MKKSIILLSKIILTTLIILWVCLLLVESSRFKRDEPMLVQIHKETLKYADGTVEVYYGLGYKGIRYNRFSRNGKEFGHIFIKVKE